MSHAEVQKAYDVLFARELTDQEVFTYDYSEYSSIARSDVRSVVDARVAYDNAVRELRWSERRLAAAEADAKLPNQRVCAKYMYWLACDCRSREAVRQAAHAWLCVLVSDFTRRWPSLQRLLTRAAVCTARG